MVPQWKSPLSLKGASNSVGAIGSNGLGVAECRFWRRRSGASASVGGHRVKSSGEDGYDKSRCTIRGSSQAHPTPCQSGEGGGAWTPVEMEGHASWGCCVAWEVQELMVLVPFFLRGLTPHEWS